MPLSAATHRTDHADRRGTALVLAIVLWLVYAALHSALDYGAKFGGPARSSMPVVDFLHIAAREANFWLGHTLVAIPAAALTCWVLAPWWLPFVRRVLARTEGDQALDARERRAMLLAYGVVLFLIARIGHEFVLLGLPVTDDEYAVGFGGKVLAEGRLLVPIPEPRGAYTQLFVYIRDGQITSMDFPLVVATAGLGEATGLGASVHAFVAAGTGVAVVAASHRAWGLRAACVAALIWTLSPMAWSLSMTIHGHLTSRCFVALTLFFAAGLHAPERGEARRRTWFGLGLAAGLGFCARPAEVGLLLAPFGAWMAWRAVLDGPATRRGVAMALLGVAIPLAGFAAFNAALTGDPFVPARIAPAPGTTNEMTSQGFWGRMGLNMGFNLVLLGIFFLGPIGVALGVLGVVSRNVPARGFALALAAGFGGHLMLALAHDNIGIHTVGPIHYSDAAPVLTLMAVRGAMALGTFLRTHAQPWSERLIVTFFGTVIIAYGVFAFTHARSLHRSATRLSEPALAVEAQDIHNALIVAPPPGFRHDLMRDPHSSWVFQHPPPSPYMTDDVLWVYPTVPFSEYVRVFPDRSIYELIYDELGNIEIIPVVEK